MDVTEAPLAVSYRREPDGSLSVVVSGDVTFTDAIGLLGAVAGASPGRPPVVSIDMAGVTFLDSIGIAVLVTCHRAAAEAGRRLVLCNVSGVAARALNVCGLAPMFGMAEPPDPVPAG